MLTQKGAELEQIFAFDVFQKELRTGLGEVVQRGRAGRQGFGFLGELGFLKEFGHCCRDRPVTIFAVLWQDRDTVVARVQFCLFALAARGGIGRVFAHRQADAPAVFSPFQVVGAVGAPFWLAVDNDKVMLTSGLRHRRYPTILAVKTR